MLVVGSYVSPYARKVVVALTLKGVAHEVDPITPFYGSDEFSRISPLRRIPVLIDGDLVLNDSTVICEYIEETWPEPPLMPRSPRDRARARWLEEYADSRLGDLIIWRFFFALSVAPRVFKRDADPAAIARVRDVELPEVMDWIEAQAPAEGFLFGHICTADITYGAFFRNAALVGWTIDPDRWPRAAAWIARVWAVPAFATTIAYEQAIVSTRNDERRAALEAAGARLSEHSYGERSPRASIMLEQAR
ncbi:glutathione S-transferase family protein [Sphingomonas canadensis]|uniref:Glutathione S-transferase family protein n=1 Tax=Sphingomonas canadensis TaxID=1219257 RepID=A0ABW3H4J9_9SPHN|nr:glutathione S-transferase family protein [Sphingomonas canadensis]MCW3836126.1 glutathione S-transferase family protein [Sphingomonas canadensis]